MLITRDIINKNIRFHNLRLLKDGSTTVESFTINDLYTLIDQYKNLLVTKGAKPGFSAIIGDNITLSQTAFVFACSELGVNVSIVDNPHGRAVKSNIYIPGHISEKLQKMLPITYLLNKNEHYALTNAKTKLLAEIVTESIIADQHVLDDTPNRSVLAEPNTIFLRSTSSGSTGDPRLFEHNHHFMHDLICRNSKMFYGSVAMIANLNHGSSPATYFLPALASDKVTDFYHVQINGELFDCWNAMLAIFSKKNTELNFNHIMFPYTDLIDNFLKTKPAFPECTLYTLSYIKKDWVKFVREGNLKDIISIFGTTETSGALLINQASDIDFAENAYKKYDDFYKLEVNDKNEFFVHMPVYNRTTVTGDSFTLANGKYLHNGRSQVFRINDLEIDPKMYLSMLENPEDADMIIDMLNNRICLAVWNKEISEAEIKKMDQSMRENSNNLHMIKQYQYLNKKDFMNGIKLDKQMLREHFRNKHSLL